METQQLAADIAAREALTRVLISRHKFEPEFAVFVVSRIVDAPDNLVRVIRMQIWLPGTLAERAQLASDLLRECGYMPAQEKVSP